MFPNKCRHHFDHRRMCAGPYRIRHCQPLLHRLRSMLVRARSDLMPSIIPFDDCPARWKQMHSGESKLAHTSHIKVRTQSEMPCRRNVAWTYRNTFCWGQFDRTVSLHQIRDVFSSHFIQINLGQREYQHSANDTHAWNNGALERC